MSLVEYWLIASEKEGKGMSFVLRIGMGFILVRGSEDKIETSTRIRKSDRVERILGDTVLDWH